MYRYLKLSDPVVICPYNKSHVISKSRLQRHLIKCEKQYPEHYKVMCPYDATHRLDKSEIEEHIMTYHTCNVLDSEIHSGASNHGCTNFPLPSEITSTVDCTDNWDSDIDSDSIALDKKCAEKIKLVLPRVDLVNETEDLRPPRGYSEAMLKEFNDDSVMEDTESIYSSSGIGRGRIIQEIQMKLIGWGRGKNSSI